MLHSEEKVIKRTILNTLIDSVGSMKSVFTVKHDSTYTTQQGLKIIQERNEIPGKNMRSNYNLTG
jgi:hypothetical protein